MSSSSYIYFPSLGLLYFITVANSWTYLKSGGTLDWLTNNSTCDKSSQSPIDIVTSVAIYKEFPPFRMEHYTSAAREALITNNGHSVEIHLSETPKATLSGGGLSGTYTAEQFHLHWGSSKNHGSEHFLDGNAFPMEMHIVHFSQKYPNISEALTKKDGLVVMAIFFEETNYNNTEFQCIIGSLPRIRKPGSRGYSDCNLLKLMPKNLDRFYRYTGSLTTPPCSESVVWTIYPEVIKISSWQMNQLRIQLRRTYNGENVALVNNYRGLQPRNHRSIYRSTTASRAAFLWQYNHGNFFLAMLLSVANLVLVLTTDVI